MSIETVIYQDKGYYEKNGGLRTYVFDEFKETRDSLFFYNLNDVESINGIHLDELKLKKGEIYLIQNKKGELKKIITEQKNLHPVTKEFIDGITYFLTPKNKIAVSKFSERGIFREAKIPKQ